jgi:hypothetical protein
MDTLNIFFGKKKLSPVLSSEQTTPGNNANTPFSSSVLKNREREREREKREDRRKERRTNYQRFSRWFVFCFLRAKKRERKKERKKWKIGRRR